MLIRLLAPVPSSKALGALDCSEPPIREPRGLSSRVCWVVKDFLLTSLRAGEPVPSAPNLRESCTEQ